LPAHPAAWPSAIDTLCLHPRLCSERYTANTAATGLHCYDETAWRIQPAPGADEVLWGNLSMRYNHRVARTIGMWALFIAFLLFYVPVTAAIQAVVNLDNIRSVPGLGLITRIPFVTQVLQGILPGGCWWGFAA
jgi:hypothetical protein